MRRGEYWGKWDVLDDRLLIHGTKSDGAERFVPRICTPVRPITLYPAFQRQLKALGVTCHDGRRTFTHWMERAGIDDSRVDFYLGHTVKNVAALYRQHDANFYLVEDAKALIALRGPEPRHLSVMA